MKIITLFLILPLLSTQLLAEEIRTNFKFKNYSQAEKEKSFIRFQIKSTKAGIFTTTVPGFAKEFLALADFNLISNKVKNMKISFKTLDLVTSDDPTSGRDEKMHNYCLDHKKFAKIDITIPTEISMSKKEVASTALINIRGKTHKVKVMLKVVQDDHNITVTGLSQLSFKKLNIPDPSILVASVADPIEVQFKIILTKPEVKGIPL